MALDSDHGRSAGECFPYSMTSSVILTALPTETFVCGVLSYFGLPNSLETAYFLSPEERQFARQRVLLDSPTVTEGQVYPISKCLISLETSV